MTRTRAAALAAALLVVAACGGDDDDASTVDETETTTTTDAPVEDGTTTTAAADDPFEPADARDFGPGGAAGVHPDAPIAYVLAEDPSSDETGCEGAPRTFLWAHPLDESDTSARVRATPGALDVAGEVLLGGADGAVALVEQCEGFLVTLATAVAAPDGTLTDVTAIELSGALDDGQIVPTSISWARDGQSWVGIFQRYEGLDDVVRIGLDGAVTVLATFEEPTAAVELPDGTLVVSNPAGVRVGEEDPVADQAYDLRVAPSGDRVAVFNQQGVTIIGPGVEAEVVYEGDVSTGSWAPDGDALVLLDVTDADAGGRIVLVDLADGAEHELSAHAGFATPLFTTDGTTVVYSDAVPHPDGYDVPELMAREVR